MEDNNKKKPTLENKHLVSFIEDLCFQLGLNTAHDYDGVESDDDIPLYQNAIKERINKLRKSQKGGQT